MWKYIQFSNSVLQVLSFNSLVVVFMPKLYVIFQIVMIDICMQDLMHSIMSNSRSSFANKSGTDNTNTTVLHKATKKSFIWHQDCNHAGCALKWDFFGKWFFTLMRISAGSVCHTLYFPKMYLSGCCCPV